ncbi:amidohydrolase family protein [Mycobacterium ulcerans str. Harvey]|uniref:Amidohydrolase family protein n=1 Tax=Mycobacterium ulcerans str. Harvey TaxID=1299332 RepID=A0ABN0R3J8_MYCUL|nr:amidohydrolase family protein [Mycobacterium ulcerans str. Harvey]
MLDGSTADIRVCARIQEVGQGLVARPGERVLDAAGQTVLPGLHDHHVHLRSAASAVDSLTLGPPTVDSKEKFRQHLSSAQPGPDGWIRAVGYHEAVAGPLDRTVLDALVPHLPVRVQHRSGALWILNSAALNRIGLAGHVDGRLRSADSDWSDALPRRKTDLAELGDRLTAAGVTGVTDATPDLSDEDMAALTVAHQRGSFVRGSGFFLPARRSCVTITWTWKR